MIVPGLLPVWAAPRGLAARVIGLGLACLEVLRFRAGNLTVVLARPPGRDLATIADEGVVAREGGA